MPELPEVEILVRHLAPLLEGRRILGVDVRRPRIVRPHLPADLVTVLGGAVIERVRRRAKFLLFDLRLRGTGPAASGLLIGHLGMTGRMFLQGGGQPLPKHAAVVMDLGDSQWVFEDPRYFGRLTLDAGVLADLGPEPLENDFSAESLRAVLRGSKQAIKVKLLDQGVVAGVGNIYASEALHRAGLSPRRPAGRLTRAEVIALWRALREVLSGAIRFGSTLPLDFAGERNEDGLFYFGRGPGRAESDTERLRVYDRARQPCGRCGALIRRIVQAGRSTFYCPKCQR